jgi:hypothetical protein
MQYKIIYMISVQSPSRKWQAAETHGLILVGKEFSYKGMEND